ncbi:MAG TPA: DUF308 domain-containing protein [Draconibacterium sp.]|nr:DUF308 domain-containing protein [Draconibacterium sp.]
MNTTNVRSSKKYWWIPFLSGFIFLLFGIWFLIAPLESFQSLAIVFGIIMFISGILELYIFIKSEKGFMNNLSFLLGGVLNIVLAILLIVNPRTILLIISILIGFWLIFKGGEQIKRAINLRKNKNPVWKRVLTLGILMTVVAAILLWHPEVIGFTIALWTSIAFIMIGVFRIYLALRLKAVK